MAQLQNLGHFSSGLGWKRACGSACVCTFSWGGWAEGPWWSLVEPGCGPRLTPHWSPHSPPNAPHHPPSASCQPPAPERCVPQSHLNFYPTCTSLQPWTLAELRPDPLFTNLSIILCHFITISQKYNSIQTHNLSTSVFHLNIFFSHQSFQSSTVLNQHHFPRS